MLNSNTHLLTCALMKIIAVLNEKGGTGKSTVATNLATALHRQGRKVVLLDCDPQGTARDWRDASPVDADLPPVLGVDRPQMLASSIAGVQADIAIVDGPAKAESMSAAIVKLAHVALLVIQPSGADLWASGAAVKLIQAKRDVGGEIDAAFLVNRASESTKLSRLIKDGAWNTYEGIEKLEAVIGNRAAFAVAMTEGISVLDMNDSKAKKEILAVINELESAKWL